MMAKWEYGQSRKLFEEEEAAAAAPLHERARESTNPIREIGRAHV